MGHEPRGRAASLKTIVNKLWQKSRPLLVAGAAGAALGGVWFARSAPQPKTELPLVVQSIQSMGVLRTAALNSTDIVEVETSKEAPGLLAMAPGLSWAARAATTNKAVLGVDGRIEAGIDLSRAKVTQVGQSRLLVVLPRAELGRPAVDGKLIHAQRGLLWRDPDIALDGLAKARARLADSARQAQLAAKAEAGASDLVKGLGAQAGWTIQVEFSGQV